MDTVKTYRFKNAIGTVEKIEFYCKAGKYNHKWRTGWVFVVNGEEVYGDGTNGFVHAGIYEYPYYRTRKALLHDIEEEENNEFDKK